MLIKCSGNRIIGKSGLWTSPKEEYTRKAEDVPSEKSEESREEQSEKRAQEERNVRHHSTCSGRRQWKSRKGKENDVNKGGTKQS